MPTDPSGLAVIAISSAVALLLAVPLWRRPGGAAGTLAWTVILAAPVVGPVAFAILHDPPAPRAGCGSCGSGGCGASDEGAEVGGSLADAVRDHDGT